VACGPLSVVIASLGSVVLLCPLAGGGVSKAPAIRAEGTAWATSRGPDTVTAFDGATGRVLATVPVGKAPMGLAVPRGTNKLYVGNEGSNSVSVISLSRREVIKTIDVGSRPHHMHASADGNRVYVAEFGTNKIGVIDTMTDTLIAEWATGPPTERTHAPAPTHDGKTLYAVNSMSNTLVALDAHTGAIQWSMRTGANPSELHITHDGRTGYLSVRNDDEVEVLDLAARQVTRRIPVGDQPDTVQLSPDEQTLVVALRGTPAEVDVINLRSFAVSKILFPAERLAGHNWLSANGRYTFVSLDDPGAVGVIDHRTNSIVATWPYPGGGSVHGMFYDDPRAAGGPGISILRRGASVDRTGTARIRVRCAEQTVGFCRGGGIVLRQQHRKLGSGPLYLRSGSTRRVAVKLTAQGEKALFRRGRLAVVATATAFDLNDNRNSVSRRIVLRRARR
jgi:YVTN family beta-propeller protein